jgi:hypothetical protein
MNLRVVSPSLLVLQIFVGGLQCGSRYHDVGPKL